MREEKNVWSCRRNSHDSILEQYVNPFICYPKRNIHILSNKSKIRTSPEHSLWGGEDLHINRHKASKKGHGGLALAPRAPHACSSKLHLLVFNCYPINHNSHCKATIASEISTHIPNLHCQSRVVFGSWSRYHEDKFT